jgi:hypothetical protein
MISAFIIKYVSNTILRRIFLAIVDNWLALAIILACAIGMLMLLSSWRSENKLRQESEIRAVEVYKQDTAKLSKALAESEKAKEQALKDAENLAELVKKSANNYKGDKAQDSYCRVYFCSLKTLLPECTEWKRDQGDVVICG